MASRKRKRAADSTESKKVSLRQPKKAKIQPEFYWNGLPFPRAGIERREIHNADSLLGMTVMSVKWFEVRRVTRQNHVEYKQVPGPVKSFYPLSGRLARVDLTIERLYKVQGVLEVFDDTEAGPVLQYRYYLENHAAWGIEWADYRGSRIAKLCNVSTRPVLRGHIMLPEGIIGRQIDFLDKEQKDGCLAHKEARDGRPDRDDWRLHEQQTLKAIGANMLPPPLSAIVLSYLWHTDWRALCVRFGVSADKIAAEDSFFAHTAGL